VFFVRRCEECEDMMDIWTKLNSEWEGHETGVIAQTNCDTEEGRPICDYFHVEVSILNLILLGKKIAKD
jgi:hypothetical protein